MKSKRPHDERPYWLDYPRNVDKVVWALYALCGLLLVADFFFHKHPHFAFESWFGFYAFFGLIGSVGLVLTSKALRKILKRDEDYYD